MAEIPLKWIVSWLIFVTSQKKIKSAFLFNKMHIVYLKLCRKFQFEPNVSWLPKVKIKTRKLKQSVKTKGKTPKTESVLTENRKYRMNHFRTTNSIWLEKNMSRLRGEWLRCMRCMYIWCDTCNPLVDMWAVSHTFSVNYIDMPFISSASVYQNHSVYVSVLKGYVRKYVMSFLLRK